MFFLDRTKLNSCVLICFSPLATIAVFFLSTVILIVPLSTGGADGVMGTNIMQVLMGLQADPTPWLGSSRGKYNTHGRDPLVSVV